MALLRSPCSADNTLPPKPGWLQMAPIITYFLGFFLWAENTDLGGFIKNGMLKDAILHRIFSHPGQEFSSCKRLARWTCF